jgi:hypothetical protein
MVGSKVATIEQQIRNVHERLAALELTRAATTLKTGFDIIFDSQIVTAATLPYQSYK